ncbi:adenylate cyclase-like protein [Dothistroma septosporum NZE10]|uniref:Adenylate cyclase n=1 Tax=Dothistroma septosporum (strain NZE10 / CBS 128990) TaxID=675120 RepID=N1PJA3_DOTSN|nr:adenylate cyclase-like protein [Dothistroma septosporum NZE10]
MTLRGSSDGQRHGSTGADSTRSNDTIRGPFGSFSSVRLGPQKLHINRQKLERQDSQEISPSTIVPRTAPHNARASNARADSTPWEDHTPPADKNIPSISHHPPTATSAAPPMAPWNSNDNDRAPHMPQSVFTGSFYNDSNEDLGQVSPRFTPGGPMGFTGDNEDRRPSIASATTVSSTGSAKNSISGRMHKKLQGFFGEDVRDAMSEGRDSSRQNSEASSVHHGQGQLPPFAPGGGTGRNRNNSMNDAMMRSGPPSPSSQSRPRTPIPQPSSEVTPWIYQDAESTPAGSNNSFFPEQTFNGRGAKNSTASRLHLPGHRHNRSTDEKQSSGLGFPLRPSTSREQSFSIMRRGDGDQRSAMSSALNLKATRSTSPAPSAHSTQSQQPNQKSPSGAGHKRSLFDRVTGRHKNDRANPETLQSNSVTSLPTLQPASTKPRSDSKAVASKPRVSKGDNSDGAAAAQKKEHSRLPFKSKKTTDTVVDANRIKDPNAPHDPAADALWHLDTDMSHMEGIIDHKQPPMTPPSNEIYTGWPPEQPQPERQNEEKGAWDAPESWAVSKIADENMRRLTELDELGDVPRDDDPGPMFFMRIFRADSTFAVISASLNTTAAELISMMAKKTFLQDELDKYQIVMRKQDTSRQLSPGERPLVMQKRLLGMVGYQQNDKLDELGREDHGYLCRFTFLPSKMSGYSSLERDPGFNKMQRFNHIDLSGRNLITIPITLYQKATEIITLNLSRNLTLDVPKDFIQSCSQLREIKFTSNEAWKLPPSLSLAGRLTTLDVSNNRLEQLEHAELNRLQGLLSLKLSNNMLTSVPTYFGAFRALRSLNLSSNSLMEFPQPLRDLTTLVDLDVSFNSISTFGDISTLTNLERLWATNNKLSGPFDPSFAALENLREIDARFNAISDINVISQLPRLEALMLGHNSVSQFEGSFHCLKVLFLNHNPVTNFDLNWPVPTLSVLNLASAKLSRLPDALFMKIQNLTKLTISKNHFVSLSPHFGLLSKLEYLSIAKNELSRLPAEIGRLTELRYLDVRENNLGLLPPEIWFAKRLETLNVSSNVLADFPKPGAPLPTLPEANLMMTPSQIPNASPEFEELGRLEDFQLRRPSQASSGLSSTGSPSGTASRKGSVVSYNSAKAPTVARSSTASSVGTITPTGGSRKDSTLSGRLAATFSTSLRHLFLADNRLEDDVFNELVLLPELRILNLSYNQLYDVPPRTIRKWTYLTELYLSGNDLTSIPSEDFEESSSLKVLHLNNNKFQVLPAELGKVQRLAILDVGSNLLKYNVSNWPYDWNWNWNRQLRYLNLSGNKRLEIKPSSQTNNGRDQRDLTDFSSLVNLRILGLMDVTLTIPSVPDQAPDRRVRLAGSIIGNTVPYGMADTLGRNEHLSTLDMVVPRFRGHEDEALIGLFDGQSLSSGGSKIAKYLHEKFKHYFVEEIEKLPQDETPLDAMRRTYLALNKELATAANQGIDAREHASSALVHRGSISGPELGDDDLNSGCTATVMYLRGMELYMSNVGDAQCLLIQSEGSHRALTRKHDPAEASERQRIREAGGFVSRQGKLNDQIDVSRAFGFVQLTPCMIAAPHVSKIDIKDSDEMILLASRELWDYLTPDFAVDVARQERSDLMRAAQKLRDLAIAFGATGKIMVMIVGVSDLRKREKARFRTHSMSMGPSGSPDDYFTTVRKAKRGRDAVGDQKLARLDQEVDAPTGEVTLVFTDIKNSTILWETYPIAMQSAIKMHNEVMRRHLRIIGGYEVKTEGDAFMVAFPTVTSALLWCFTIQSQLLDVQWPQEILSSVHGEEMLDADGIRIFRGLSVRMGIHWGRPVCEIDPVTKRMDYFGPMVNRAARIESVADGGQICVSSDFIQEVQRMLESHIESDRTGSTGSEDTLNDDVLSQTIRRELRSLSSQGFEVKDLGQRTLKGLENPEYIYLMYPHSLASRLIVQQQKAEAESRIQQESQAKKTQNSQLTIDTDNVWDLWNVSLRLEMLCSTLENSGARSLRNPETALLEKIKNGGGEITDRFLVNFVEHQISRIETCVTTLAVRNMVKPFKNGILDQACPMLDILGDLGAQLEELKSLRSQAEEQGFEMAPS